METSSFILSLFRQFLPVVFSWGFSNPEALDNGLRFSVQGFLHKGIVEVLYNEGQDTFTIKLLDSNGVCVRVEDGIYVDSLVDVADSIIEYCPNYEQKVQGEYGMI